MKKSYYAFLCAALVAITSPVAAFPSFTSTWNSLQSMWKTHAQPLFSQLQHEVTDMPTWMKIAWIGSGLGLSAVYISWQTHKPQDPLSPASPTSCETIKDIQRAIAERKITTKEQIKKALEHVAPREIADHTKKVKGSQVPYNEKLFDYLRQGRASKIE